MQLEGMEQLISGIILAILGIGIILKSKNIAEICRENKTKLFGEARYDRISEVVARLLLALVGIVAILGSFLEVCEYISQ